MAFECESNVTATCCHRYPQTRMVLERKHKEQNAKCADSLSANKKCIEPSKALTLLRSKGHCLATQFN